MGLWRWRSFRKTVRTIIKKYGLNGHPGLIHAETSPLAILPLRLLISHVGSEEMDWMRFNGRTWLKTNTQRSPLRQLQLLKHKQGHLALLLAIRPVLQDSGRSALVCLTSLLIPAPTGSLIDLYRTRGFASSVKATLAQANFGRALNLQQFIKTVLPRLNFASLAPATCSCTAPRQSFSSRRAPGSVSSRPGFQPAQSQAFPGPPGCRPIGTYAISGLI